MREIKFRVWDKAEDRFLQDGYGTHAYNEWYLTFDGKVAAFFGEIGSDLVEREYNLAAFDRKTNTLLKTEDRFIIQQAIGIKDKNDKDIFEGDIVSFKVNVGDFVPQYVDEIGTVEYYERGGFYKVVDNKHGDTIDVLDRFGRHYTVVGNIFENKELLNERD